MITLGVDTSNYATSLAVFDAATRKVLAAHKVFLPVPKGQKGMRQSDAVFHHTKQLPHSLVTLEKEADLTKVQAVGVSVRPRPTADSYMPCFLVGKAFAYAFAASKGLPVVEISHQQNHAAAALLGADKEEFATAPHLLFHVSGGTTELLLADGTGGLQPLFASGDLYAGQAIDRLGVRLGFSFPAGEQLSALAEQYKEPLQGRAFLTAEGCSFSGLQNQCEQMLSQGEPPAKAAKYCLLSVAETLRGLPAAPSQRRARPAASCGRGRCHRQQRDPAYFVKRTKCVFCAARLCGGQCHRGGRVGWG